MGDGLVLVLLSNVDSLPDHQLALVCTIMDSSDSVTELSDDVSTCLWWSGLDFVDLSISHSHNSVSKGFETDIVSNHNHSNLFFHVQVDKNFHDDVSAARIEISGGLIEKQNLGLVGNGTSNRNTLLLTT